MSEICNRALASSGEKKIAWARRNMPLLDGIEKELYETKPFRGLKIALSVHMEAKTARLCRAMREAGAEMHVTGCNPLSTQDDVAAALDAGGIDVHAVHGASPEEYERHLTAVLEAGPNIIIDDGGDLVNLVHTKMTHLIPNIIGGCEETTTGVIRLYAMAREGSLKFPMITVNNARASTCSTTATGRASPSGTASTARRISSWRQARRHRRIRLVRQGIAMRARGFGARVVITEIDPVKALEAMMDGFDVLPMADAAGIGDLFITATGCSGVITQEHFGAMKDGAVLCNAGHFNVEVDVGWLDANAERREEQKPNIMGYTLLGGKTLFVLAEGRLVNLASGDGHPVEIMDMSFAIQALCAKYLADNRDSSQLASCRAGGNDTAVALKSSLPAAFPSTRSRRSRRNISTAG
jgi:adenosylhomocysteinase